MIRRPDFTVRSQLEQAKQHLHMELMNSRSIFESKLVQEFDYSNSLKNLQINVTALFHLMLKQGFRFATTNCEKAFLLYHYFQSVFILQVIYLYLSSVKPQTIILSDYDSLDVLNVFELLVSLDVTNSMRIEGMGPKVLKHCATALCVLLHYLFSLSLSQHTLPDEWQIHFVSPIYKSGDNSNYRSTSRIKDPLAETRSRTSRFWVG